MSRYRFRKRDMSKWSKADGRHALSFLINLEEIEKEFQVTSRKGDSVPIQEGFRLAIHLVTRAAQQGKKIIFIGNGGSAAIASHQAVDYWKNGGIEAIAFNDSSLLTCLANDYGYEQVFAVPIKRFARAGDVLIAISSSGKSANILNGARTALEMGCRLISFSGFSAANPLRGMGDVNFYVPSSAYGLVEVSHLALIHSILREIIYINPIAAKKRY